MKLYMGVMLTEIRMSDMRSRLCYASDSWRKIAISNNVGSVNNF